MEEWIKSLWNGDKYDISTYGSVRNKKTGRILKPGHTKDGYLQVVLYCRGKKRTFRLHRLVWESFNGPIPEGMQVNHINEDKTDCSLANLSLATPKENVNWGTKIKRTAISLQGKLVNREDQSTPVQQFKIDGTFIAAYKSTMEAERQNPGLFHSRISSCCKGKAKTHRGFIWKYAD